MEITPLIAFGAGLVSVFTPCVLIVLPAVMASSTDGGKWRPLAIVLGLSMSFTAMGVLASAFGSVFQSVKWYLDVIAIIIVMIIGVWMLFDLHLPYNAPRLGFVDAVSKRSYKLPTEGVISGVLARHVARDHLVTVHRRCVRRDTYVGRSTWKCAHGRTPPSGILARICSPDARRCLFDKAVIISRCQDCKHYLDQAGCGISASYSRRLPHKPAFFILLG